MSKLAIMPGSTSQILYLFIQDSSVTTGAGLTGLAYNTGSLTAYYVRPGGSATSITLATQTATGAYSSGGFVAVDGTNMPGVYRFDPPDAALASGVRSVLIMLKGAANMAPCLLEIDLNAQVNTTHVGGTLQTAGDIMADTNDIQSRLPAALVSGRMDVSVGAMAANVMTAAAAASDLTTEFQSGLATSAALATVDTVVDAIKVTTDKLDTAMEADSAVYRFTTNALEQAPTGGGSGGLVTSGTAAGIASGTITLASGHGISDTTVLVVLTGGTNADGKSRMATYSGTGDVFNVDPAWNATVNGNAETTPSGTITYEVYPYPAMPSTNVPAVDVTSLGGSAQSATDLKDFADAGYDPSTNKVQGVVLTDTVTTYTGNTPQTGDSYARLGAPAGASVSADIAAIEAQTDDIGAAGAGLTAIPWNASWDAEVQSEVADALTAFGVPTLTQINSTRYLKNTAGQRVYFTLVNSTDHVTREPGITVTAQRSLDAGTSFSSATGTVTEVASGVYFLTPSQADTNADDIIFRFTGTGCDPVELHVVTAS